MEIQLQQESPFPLVDLAPEDFPFGDPFSPANTEFGPPPADWADSEEPEVEIRRANDESLPKPSAAPTYSYKMVQIPPNIQINEGASTKGVAASYLEAVVNEYAQKGWDFFRVDQIGIQIYPGCLSRLVGVGVQTVAYYVVTFRKLDN